MRPPASATGGETRPLAARINPMKNIFLDTQAVSLWLAVRVQAEVLMAHLRFLWGQHGYDRLVLSDVLWMPARASRYLRNSRARPSGSGVGLLVTSSFMRWHSLAHG